MFQFPQHLHDDVAKASAWILQSKSASTTLFKSEEMVEYVDQDEVIRFPYRVYYEDDSNTYLHMLTNQEKMIVHCIYSRSHDGFIRQKHLHALLCMTYADWTIPYIVKACDEYVVGILEMTYRLINPQDYERFKRFTLQNTATFCKSYDRMTSYWDAYQLNTYPQFQQYIGKKLFRECFGYTRAMCMKKY